MKKSKEIPDNTEEILEEIARLKNSPYVKLAKATQNKMLKQKLYQLRSLEKQGRAIAEALGEDIEKVGDDL